MQEKVLEVRFAAATALLLKDNELVLVKLRENQQWVLVGGTLEEGEDEADCIEREVLEESGLTATILMPDGTPASRENRAPLFIEEDPTRDRRKLILGDQWSKDFLAKYPTFDLENGRLILGDPDHVFLIRGDGYFALGDPDEVEEVRAFPLHQIPFSQIGRGHERYIHRFLTMLGIRF